MSNDDLLNRITALEYRIDQQDKLLSHLASCTGASIPLFVNLRKQSELLLYSQVFLATSQVFIWYQVFTK